MAFPAPVIPADEPNHPAMPAGPFFRYCAWIWFCAGVVAATAPAQTAAPSRAEPLPPTVVRSDSLWDESSLWVAEPRPALAPADRPPVAEPVVSNPQTPALPSTLATPAPLTVVPDETLVDGGDAPWNELLEYGSSEPWHWQLLPVGILYKSYLAGTREARMGSVFNYQRDWGGLWDIALGARAGLFRYGTDDPIRPEGYQLDIEGVTFPRLDLEEKEDMVSTDFRFGIPLTYRRGRWEYKFGYYHISSHLGDEYMLKNPDVPRRNYVRETMILGVAWFQNPWLRWYAEAGWAFLRDVSEPWEVQFGADFAPPGPTGIEGAPFWALNTYLREDVDFSGNFVAQIGWSWRGAPSGHLLRLGFEYFNGLSTQGEFYDQFEEKIGLGLWFDF